MKTSPSLFGLKYSNRDFSLKDTWGKNQFNSSFPVSLCCYMASKNIEANYLAIENGEIKCKPISITSVFGIEADDEEIFFAFETAFSPFNRYVIGSLPRTDVVIQNRTTGQCLSGLEIKLTAIPDHTTCHLTDDLLGSEIVVRPDSIVYLACSIVNGLEKSKLSHLVVQHKFKDMDWSEPKDIILIFPYIKKTLENIIKHDESFQKPFLLQPIWKTEGKSSKLSNNCLDVFVWSDFSFVKFIYSISNFSTDCLSINRATRSAIWLYKMLFDIVNEGKFNHRDIIDRCSYNTKNDKAFAASGQITNQFMRSVRLENPIIHKSEIKNLILGGGQDLLSPERRFDAIIFNSPELFL